MITPNQLRDKFRQFFLSRKHAEIPSASLIPASDDPTVLFTTAGMQPLVPNLMGAPHPKGTRLFDTQKSFRTPDIDEVGDDTHHTFFEMLGNWSLGDYFKEEAIELAYDFFVTELGLDPKRFAITIFQGDDDAPKDEEAKRLWMRHGITEEQIYEFDKEDNFWGPAGTVGPCGPCSEIHYDRGPEYGEDFGPNVDENQRYVEIWNLVFMEYNKKEDGSYEKLEQKNVDTGVGFERLLAVLNQQDSAFDTPLFDKILGVISKITGKTYAEEKRRFRIVADHVRGSTFLIADGVLPSNEGRGYVLRRLLRRAIREGRLMGISDLFLTKVAEAVITDYAEHYSELKERKKTIFQTMNLEEEQFRKTLQNGERMLLELESKGAKEIDGKTAFALFDTYGFPFDLTKDFALEHRMTVDEKGYEQEMDTQKKRSKEGAKGMFARDTALQMFTKLSPSIFLGYNTWEYRSKVTNVASSEGKTFFVLSETPFYAESGGQIGDSGVLIGKHGTAQIIDCQKVGEGVFVHIVNKVEGEIKEGEVVEAKINIGRRFQIRRHHSVAHLFLAAAQQVLGGEIHQAGSHVNEHRMRIDFTFPRALHMEEIEAIESQMQQAIAASLDVVTEEKSLEQAKKEGAEATFGEKYGEEVRTVRMGEVSYELCGGTHVENTAEIGSVKILSESGVSAGVRRVEVVASASAQALLDEEHALLREVAELLKAPKPELTTKIKSLQAELKLQRQEIGDLQTQLASLQAARWAEEAIEKDGKRIFIKLQQEDELLQTLAKSLVANGVDIVVLLGKGGQFVIATKGPEARQTLQKLTTAFGGGGGGSETFARGGGMQARNVEAVMKEL